VPLASFLPTLVTLGAMLVIVGIGEVVRRRLHSAKRRSPLTRDLLRSPGHSLREQLDELRWDMTTYLSMGMVMPLALYAGHLQQQVLGVRASPLHIGLLLVAGIGFVAHATIRVTKAVRSAHRLKLGIDAELAAGEELNQLMREGFWVFHDVPGEKHFNIDHVVLGPSGVFAIETKGRPKRHRDASEDGHKVRYDGKALQFPGWRETEPLRQAELNADWLRKWLSSAVGEPLVVRPVVMLPGWYVDRTAGEGIPVLNEKQAKGYVTKRRGPDLAAKLLQQIAHQLDQRCRDVAARAYSSPTQ
jgi:hypothetical protein